MIRFGNISSIDAANCRVRVQFDDDGMVSHWLPVVVNGSRDNKYFHIFDVNEHVVCLMDEYSENGVVIGAIYDSQNAAGVSKDKARIEFSDGAIVEYDRSVSSMKVAISTTEITVKPTGFAMTKGGESLRQMISDLLDQLVLETHTSAAPGSPTSPPLNLAAYQAIKTRILAFFTA